jgi:hypothetical protein
MRPRNFATAALSAALSVALASAADPQPLPPVSTPPQPAPAVSLPTLPAIPVPNAKVPVAPPAAGVTIPPATDVPSAKPIAPNFLPAVKPMEKSEARPQEQTPPNLLPTVPPPRKPGEPAPKAVEAPVLPPTPTPAPAVMPVGECPPLPRDTSIYDDHLGPWNAVWVRGGYSYLWLRDAPTGPPLLTSNGTPVAGDSTNDLGGFSAISLEGGMWLNDSHTFGIGAAGFLAEKRSNVRAFSSDAAGSPSLRRPFFNALIGGQNGQDEFIVSDPGRFAGSFAVEQGARVDGFEIYGLMNVANTERWTTNFSVGFRYFSLDEYTTTYQVTQSLTGNTIPFFGQAPVSAVAITDRVRTRNQFYGGQMGGDVEYRFGPMFLDLGVKAALGSNHQVTEIQGTTQIPGGAGGPGGFLAVGAIPNGNQGRISTNNFAVLADVNSLVGVQVSTNFRIGVGYQFLYLNNVVRPSNQFVSTIDPRLIPASASFGARAPSDTSQGGRGTPPYSPIDRDDFFLHGFRILVELQF